MGRDFLMYILFPELFISTSFRFLGINNPKSDIGNPKKINVGLYRQGRVDFAGNLLEEG